MKRTLPDWPCVRPDPSKDGKTLAVQQGDGTDSQQQSWPVLRRQPCPVEHEERNRGPELHAYASEGWWTVVGARIKVRRLQKAGLPNFTNWRFVTLTMATRSMSPLAAYQHGKDRLRRFLARVRKAIGRRFLWCWKLEFHDDGYAHWHLLIEYTERLPLEILSDVEEWWGL